MKRGILNIILGLLNLGFVILDIHSGHLFLALFNFLVASFCLFIGMNDYSKSSKRENPKEKPSEKEKVIRKDF